MLVLSSKYRKDAEESKMLITDDSCGYSRSARSQRARPCRCSLTPALSRSRHSLAFLALSLGGQTRMATSSNSLTDSLLIAYNKLLARYDSLQPASSSAPASLLVDLHSFAEQLRLLISSVSPNDASLALE